MYKLNTYIWFLSLGGGDYLLYNSLFQKAARIDEELKTALESRNLKELAENEDVMNLLKEIQVVLPEAFDEMAHLHSLYPHLESNFEIGYKNYVFLLSWACNLDCTYCFEKDYRKTRGKERLSVPMIRKAFTFIDTYGQEPPESLELTGGEPLLLSNREAVQCILTEGRERSLDSKTMITTNGVTLPAYADLLIEYQDILSYVRTTLDGIQDHHDKRRRRSDGSGSYDAIVRGVQALLEQGFDPRKIHITVRFDPQLSKRIGEVLETLESFDFLGKVNITFGTVDNYSVNPEKTMEAKEEIWRDFIAFFTEHSHYLRHIGLNDGTKTESILTKILIEGKTAPVTPFGCPGICGTESVACAPDGKVYFCMVPAGLQELPLGEFYPEITISPEVIQTVRQRSFFTLDACRPCKYMPVCSGGCPYAGGEGITCVMKSLFETELSEFFYQYVRPQRVKE
ncbi:MAG: radical SAM protein [Theionarchaea archaeon]|nr:radical SAM protein [Theionarchaea archaeon]